MLESISTTSLSSPIKLAEWSPKMDLIALTYLNSPETVELRRMDWTKVNSITLDSLAIAICFNPDGRMICVATSDNKLLLFNIEDSHVLTSMTFYNEITTVTIDECNGISITAVGFSDSSVFLFSDFHFSLCRFELTQPAMKISLCENEIFCLHEDHKTVTCFTLPFIESDAPFIKSVSKAFSSYWMHYHKIEKSSAQLIDLWNQIWEESSQFTPHNEDLARRFLLGQTPPELATEVHISRLHKSIAHEFTEMQNILAQDIIVSFIELDKATEQIKAALDMSTKLRINLGSTTSKKQIHNSLTMLDNLRRLSKCFEALFAFLVKSQNNTQQAQSQQTPNQTNQDNQETQNYYFLTKTNVSRSEFADFLVNFFHKFDLLDISIGEPPDSDPVFQAVHKNDIELPYRFSYVNKERCTCIGPKLVLYDLKQNESKQYDIAGQALAAYPFGDGDVGCFSESDGKAIFTMISNCEEEEGQTNQASAEVSLENSTVFFISPRRIALVESTELFASVIDLEIPENEDEEDEQ
ncbi:hypothetical protein M9Y10_002084 [Tritrichomonas musculus]|uniref:Anaphase-promoting complex subunit 4-like WD40 domain-containing protein n=1 Tax=Tritrichomonas musculus TaxID=1915356 RepID=A0ABR2LAG2_9EUKA